MTENTEKINPETTNGFEFIEFASFDSEHLKALFSSLGFTAISYHPTKKITRYQQGDINFLVTENTDFSQAFTEKHGPCACSFALRVKDADKSLPRLVEKGATAIKHPGEAGLDLPAIEGVGGSRLYLVAEHTSQDDLYEKFEPLTEKKSVANLSMIDHITHNVYSGQLDVWAGFYERLFNFKEIRYFDISGEYTGLFSRAMTGPCGKARIPINESADDKSQIAEYLKQYKGEGIQHIALTTDHIYDTVETLKSRGVPFMSPPPDSYYEMLDERLPGNGEDVTRMQKNGILLDGTGSKRLLLQIFTEPAIGPIFFEIIQRKGDDGFGEGNFKALFESMERDQIRRGVLKVDKSV